MNTGFLITFLDRWGVSVPACTPSAFNIHPNRRGKGLQEGENAQHNSQTEVQFANNQVGPVSTVSSYEHTTATCWISPDLQLQKKEVETRQLQKEEVETRQQTKKHHQEQDESSVCTELQALPVFKLETLPFSETSGPSLMQPAPSERAADEEMDMLVLRWAVVPPMKEEEEVASDLATESCEVPGFKMLDQRRQLFDWQEDGLQQPSTCELFCEQENKTEGHQQCKIEQEDEIEAENPHHHEHQLHQLNQHQNQPEADENQESKQHPLIGLQQLESASRESRKEIQEEGWWKSNS